MSLSTKRLKLSNINSNKSSKSNNQSQNLFNGSLSDSTPVVRLTPHKTLLENLNDNNAGISQSCDGHGICTTCRVKMRTPQAQEFLDLHPRSELENERAQERNFAPYERLCCQIVISELTPDLEIEWDFEDSQS